MVQAAYIASMMFMAIPSLLIFIDECRFGILDDDYRRPGDRGTISLGAMLLGAPVAYFGLTMPALLLILGAALVVIFGARRTLYELKSLKRQEYSLEWNMQREMSLSYIVKFVQIIGFLTTALKNISLSVFIIDYFIFAVVGWMISLIAFKLSVKPKLIFPAGTQAPRAVSLNKERKFVYWLEEPYLLRWVGPFLPIAVHIMPLDNWRPLHRRVMAWIKLQYGKIREKMQGLQPQPVPVADGGFTFIELMAGLSFVGILASPAVATMGSAVAITIAILTGLGVVTWLVLSHKIRGAPAALAGLVVPGWIVILALIVAGLGILIQSLPRWIKSVHGISMSLRNSSGVATDTSFEASPRSDLSRDTRTALGNDELIATNIASKGEKGRSICRLLALSRTISSGIIISIKDKILAMSFLIFSSLKPFLRRSTNLISSKLIK